MKALVTGGGGFLGSRICTMLHQRGDEVTALGRHPYPHLEQRGIPTVQADLRDAAAISQACRGMDAVFHAGAMAGVWGKRELFWDINVQGTRHVLAACREHGVGRLVYTSSPSVVFGNTDLCGVDESLPYPKRYLAHYPESKSAAERQVLAANDDALLTVALRPHLIWGPHDPHLFPRIIERARRGRLIQVGDGQNLVDITYIDNAAHAHLLAGDVLRPGAPCAGRAYFISQGEPVRLWHWLNDILQALDLPRVRRVISYRTARGLGAALERLYALLGVTREPLMTRFVAAQLAQSHYFDVSAAQRDLGYALQVSTQEGVQRLVQFFGVKPASG